MPNPLAGDKDRQFDMEFEFHHLKRSRVLVAHQVANQTAVFMTLFGAFAVGDPRGLYDRIVGAHNIHQAHEAMIENLEFAPQEIIHIGRHNRISLVETCTRPVIVIASGENPY